MFSPLQRGGVAGAGTNAAPACLQVTAPCGTVPAGAPTGAFVRESRSIVQLQKNQGHEVGGGAYPGNFSVSLWGAGDKTGHLLAERMNDERPSLSFYELEVFIRNETAPGQYILQAQYNTANPAAPATFFQCADVTVL